MEAGQHVYNRLFWNKVNNIFAFLMAFILAISVKKNYVFNNAASRLTFKLRWNEMLIVEISKM